MCKSKMQKNTASSMAEAEYFSASTAGTEILYLRALLERLGISQKAPTPVYEDDTACIEWGNNVISGRERVKHIDIRKHFAHEVIRNGEMKLIKVSTTSQRADILTKGLHLPQFLASTASSEWTRTSSRNGPLSSRGGGSLRLPESSHVGP